MGYQTYYTLEILENRTNLPEAKIIKMTVDKLREFNVIRYVFDENLETIDAVKWYDHEEDMTDVSLAVKDVLFHLHGEGEEPGDIWDKYFLNGKKQRCQARIVIDPFDEKKLE